VWSSSLSVRNLKYVCTNEADALPALLFNFVMRMCQEDQECLKVNGTHRVYDNGVSLTGHTGYTIMVLV
jgi:hypothetical protein